MKVLFEFPIYVVPPASIIFFGVTILFVVISIIVCWKLDVSRSVVATLMGMSAVALILSSVLMCIPVDSGRKSYKVILKDMAVEELYEKYRVIKVDYPIWYIEDKPHG